jgi:hypothetical protein
MNLCLSSRLDRKLDGQLVLQDFPAPWTLKVEDSWILPFSYDSRTHCIIQKSQSDRDFARSGLGTVMIVKYVSSDAGPYDEIIFLTPTSFPKIHGEWIPPYRLPIIYVSTEASLRNGRKNWGIRKELANFTWSKSYGFMYTRTSLVVTDRLTGNTLPFDIFIATLSFINRGGSI